MAVQLFENPVISFTDRDIGAVDCSPWLDPGETIVSVDDIEGLTSAGAAAPEILITNEAPNANALYILDRSIAAGLAIAFNIRGQLAGTNYLIRYTITTSAGRVATRDAPFSVAD